MKVNSSSTRKFGTAQTSKLAITIKNCLEASKYLSLSCKHYGNWNYTVGPPNIILQRQEAYRNLLFFRAPTVYERFVHAILDRISDAA